jgi:hypothetical protein
VITLNDCKVSNWRDYLDPLRVLAALEVDYGGRNGESGLARFSSP